MIERIEAALKLALEFPLAAPRRDQLRPGLRVVFEGKYAIYYKVEERDLMVIRVLHGARDATALAERGGFG